MVDDSVTVKGSPVRSLQRFVETDLDESQREVVFTALPPEYRERFRSPILATETIPVSMFNRITEEAAKAKGETLEDFARRAGREGASDAVKGVYRFIALVMTPVALLGRASQMWSSLYNCGAMEVVEQETEQEQKSARIRLVSFPSEPAGCARVTGWIERMTELTGAKEVTVVQTQCLTRGAAFCEWQLNWR